MKGFHSRTELREAIQILQSRVASLGHEKVPLEKSFNRVLAQSLVAPVAVPHFDRAAMDGYAVKGEDTFGADQLNPRELEIVGESMPGNPCALATGENQAVRIMTGAKIPQGANAVIPAEVTQELPPSRQFPFGSVQVFQAMAPGKNIGKTGEDVKAGSTILEKGRVLRPQDVGLISSVGIREIPVFASPKVRILITGNEILPAGSPPEKEKIADSNSLTLRGLVQRDGGQAIFEGIIPDDSQTLEKALSEHGSDLVLISGGSSVGKEDHAPALLKKLGELAVHGVGMRPASPAGFGFLESRIPVFLLPGNPVSCLCAYDLLASMAVRKMAGLPIELPYPRAMVKTGKKIVSAVGRVDYVRVKIATNGLLEPVVGSGASNLSSTTRADGFILIDQDSEGFPEGTPVLVYFYDSTPRGHEAGTIS
ncbi:MAG: molybdopterin molybdenumtransferase MoeA [Gemmataceae bacterium]|nr:molybdopterin molybdenumtransferase MoeA [Gemmataceae bacterium]